MPLIFNTALLMIPISKIKDTYSVDMAAVILCCRVYFGTATLADLDQFIQTNPIDLDVFCHLAAVHKVRPVVYGIICKGDISAESKADIAAKQWRVTINSWQKAVETERLILLLKSAGIRALPYKGAAYSKQFFGDLTSRESSDIDLSILPGDLDAAINVFKNDSYMPETEDVRSYLGDRYFSYYKDYNFNKFKNGTRQFHVELHWSITENYLSTDKRASVFLTRHSQHGQLVKADIPMLDHTAHFSAMLIHHALKDNFTTLKNVVDISAALRHHEIQSDKAGLYQDVNAFGLNEVLTVSDSLSDQLFGISLKNDVACHPLSSYFLDKISSRKEFGGVNEASFVSIKERFALQDTALDKAKYILQTIKKRFLPGDKDFRIFNLPKVIFFAYYFLKPFRSIFSPLNIPEEKKRIATIANLTVEPQ